MRWDRCRCVSVGESFSIFHSLKVQCLLFIVTRKSSAAHKRAHISNCNIADLAAGPTTRCGVPCPSVPASSAPLCGRSARPVCQNAALQERTTVLRTLQKSRVRIPRGLEALLHRVEQLPDQLLCVRAAWKKSETQVKTVSTRALSPHAHKTRHSPKVIGGCSGELHGLTTRVESRK
jgi:hypothetical protein